MGILLTAIQLLQILLKLSFGSVLPFLVDTPSKRFTAKMMRYRQKALFRDIHILQGGG
jgi:hypothetical protein